MSDPLRSLVEYEHFVHTLMQQFPAVRRSTVTFVRRGATLARVAGELQFDLGLRLVIRQRLLFHRLPGVIDEYGYEGWKGNEKLYWYDPSRTQGTQRSRARIRTINTSRPISSVTEFRRQT
jgi:hypothetical protein